MVEKSSSSENTAVSIADELVQLEAAIERLYACIDQSAAYVQGVVDGKAKADPKIAREIADALAAIPPMRAEQFDHIFNSGLQDLLMVAYLSGLTQAQLSMAEKLINT